MKKTIYTLLFALVPFVLSAQSTDAGKIDGDSCRALKVPTPK